MATTTHIGNAHEFTVDVDEDGYTLVIHTDLGTYNVNIGYAWRNLEDAIEEIRDTITADGGR